MGTEGGLGKVHQLFCERLIRTIDDLNSALVV
jgi:hypothetical protein